MSICCGDNPDEACGHPPKTIRAVISVTAVFFSFALFVSLALLLAVREQYTESMGIVSVISGELGTIVGYYFGTRNKSEQHQEAIEVEDRAIKLAKRIDEARFTDAEEDGV